MVLNCDKYVRVLDVTPALTRNGRRTGMRHEIRPGYFRNDRIHLNNMGARLVRGLMRKALNRVQSKGTYRRKFYFTRLGRRRGQSEALAFGERMGYLY